MQYGWLTNTAAWYLSTTSAAALIRAEAKSSLVICSGITETLRNIETPACHQCVTMSFPTLCISIHSFIRLFTHFGQDHHRSTHTPLTLTFTPRSNLESPVALNTCFWTVGGRENPHRYKENILSPNGTQPFDLYAVRQSHVAALYVNLSVKIQY